MSAGAVILAGGQSERMGRAKEWLVVAGEPLLVRVARVALVHCAPVVVVRSEGQHLPDLPTGAFAVEDPPMRTHEGPLAGLVTGLEALASRGVERAFLGASDAVFLTPEHVAFVLDSLGERDEAVLPADAAHEHPLAGAVRVEPALQAARFLLARSERRPRALYEALRTRRVAVDALPEPRAVRSCNTPDEWDAALRELHVHE